MTQVASAGCQGSITYIASLLLMTSVALAAVHSTLGVDWAQSLMSYFSGKADILSRIAIFKLNLE